MKHTLNNYLALLEQDDLITSLPADLDWYLVDKDFTWTYAHPHESALGPYFCETEQ